MPIEVMVEGCWMSLFHAAQQWVTMSSYDVKMRFESQLSRNPPLAAAFPCSEVRR